MIETQPAFVIERYTVLDFNRRDTSPAVFRTEEKATLGNGFGAPFKVS